MNLLDLDHNSLELILSYLKYRDGTSLLLTNTNLYSLLIEQLKEKIRIPRVEDDKIVTKNNKIYTDDNYTILFNRDKGFTVLFNDEFILEESEYIGDKYEIDKVIINLRPNPVNIIKSENRLYLDDLGNLHYDLYELESYRLLKTNVKDFVSNISNNLGDESLYILDNYGDIYDGNSYIYLNRSSNYVFNLEVLKFNRKFPKCELFLIKKNLIIKDLEKNEVYIYDNYEKHLEDFDEEIGDMTDMIRGDQIDDFLYKFNFEIDDEKYVTFTKIKYNEETKNMIILIDNSLFLINQNMQAFKYDKQVDNFFCFQKCEYHGTFCDVDNFLIYYNKRLFYIEENDEIIKIKREQVIDDIRETYKIDKTDEIYDDIISKHFDDYIFNYLMYGKVNRD